MTIDSFVFGGLPARVVFGQGSIGSVPDEATRLGIRRALVISSEDKAQLALSVVSALGRRAARSFTRASGRSPHDSAERAIAIARANGIDGVVSIGNGATVGVGKAVALRLGIRHLAVPTTYAGAEATPFLDPERETLGGVRAARRARPDTLVYDPAQTRDLSPELAAASGLTAIAHAVEGLYAPDGNPLVELMAEEAIRSLAAALPAIAADPADDAARALALRGGWLAGNVLAGATMGLHHDLVILVSAAHDLPYGATSAALLPHVAAFNREAAAGPLERVAAALGAQDPVAGLASLCDRVGAPTSLASIGFARGAIVGIVDRLLANPPPNPRALDRASVADLLARALEGPPATGETV